MFDLPSASIFLNFYRFGIFTQTLFSLDDRNSFFYIAAQDNIGAASRHIGGNGDGS